jgi:hypothetical protein
VLEKGEAGARYHGVAETGTPFREIATRIATRLDIPTVSCADAKSARHLGILANFIGADNPSSSEWTQRMLDWKPQGPNLLGDMDQNYFAAPTKLDQDTRHAGKQQSQAG